MGSTSIQSLLVVKYVEKSEDKEVSIQKYI